MFGRWEWIILEVLFLGLLIVELISVRRSIRHAKDAESASPPSTPFPRDAER